MSGLALVSGGAGFIGRHLVAALRADGTAVRVLDIAERPVDFPTDIDYRRGSVTDRNAVSAALRGVDELYHLAAVTHLWTRHKNTLIRVNVEGTRLVLDEVVRAKTACVVLTSTAAILRGWRERRQTPVSEADLPPALSALPGPYTRSKALAHELALKAIIQGAPLRIVYPTIPIGSGDHNLTPPTRMLIGFLNGDIPAYLNCMLNLTSVEDLARGHILAARCAADQRRFVLGGEDIELRLLLQKLEALSGCKMPKKQVPFVLSYMVGAISTALADFVTGRAPVAPLEGVKLAYAPRQVDATLSHRVLGLAPEPIDHALERTVAWLKQAKLITA